MKGHCSFSVVIPIVRCLFASAANRPVYSVITVTPEGGKMAIPEQLTMYFRLRLTSADQ